MTQLGRLEVDDVDVLGQLGRLEVDDVDVLRQDAGGLRVEAAEGGLLHRGEGGDGRAGAQAAEVAGDGGRCGY